MRCNCELNGAEQAAELILRIAARIGFEDFPISYGIESTGVYHLFFVRYFFAHADKFSCHLLNPVLLEKSVEKTDARDAEEIARLVMFSKIGLYVPVVGFQEDLRQATRFRVYLVRKRSGFLNFWDARMRYYGITLKSEIKTVWKSRGGRDFMRELAAGSRDLKFFQDILGLDNMDRDSHLWALKDIPESFNAVVQMYLDMLEGLDEKIKQSEKVIRQIISGSEELREAHDLLLTVPGFGTITAAVYLAEIGGFSVTERFKNAGSVAKYSGLCPTKRISGDKAVSFRRRFGNRHVNHALIMAANSVWKSSEDIGSWARGISGRGHRNTGKVALARRLSEIAYHVLRTKNSANLEKYDFHATERKMAKEVRKVSYILNDVKTVDVETREELTRAGAIIASKIGGSLRYAPVVGADLTMPLSKALLKKGKNGRVVRLIGLLGSNGYYTVADVVSGYWTGTLMNVSGIGPKSIELLIDRLIELNFIIDIYAKKEEEK